MSDDKKKSKPPTSRWGRFARLAGLGTKGIPLAVAGAKRVFRRKEKVLTEDEKRQAHEKLMRDGKKAAEAMLKTLGDMKGLPLKVGQMMSYIDGVAPPGYEEKLKATLKKLQDKAPPLSPEAAIKVIQSEFDLLPEELFAEWEYEPFAAASIGQVHRATTKGGDTVAVKVQYPGIDTAIRNDLKSINLLRGMLGPLTDRLHAKDALDEMTEVFLSELDYGREAEMAALFSRMHADCDSIVVPKVYQSLSTQRVITSELIGGQSYAEFCETASQEDRNAAGITIWRFMFKALMKHGYLYADPHPGNYRFLGGGKVAFLDFGCVKKLSDDLLRDMRRYMIACVDEDWDEFDRACEEVLDYKRDDPTWDLYRDYTIFLMGPLMTDQWHCTPEKARRAVTFLADGIKEVSFREGERMPTIPHVPHLPREFMFVNRLQFGLASVMGGLGCRGDFQSLTVPWVRGKTCPVT